MLEKFCTVLTVSLRKDIFDDHAFGRSGTRRLIAMNSGKCFLLCCLDTEIRIRFWQKLRTSGDDESQILDIIATSLDREKHLQLIFQAEFVGELSYTCCLDEIKPMLLTKRERSLATTQMVYLKCPLHQTIGFIPRNRGEDRIHPVSFLVLPTIKYPEFIKCRLDIGTRRSSDKFPTIDMRCEEKSCLLHLTLILQFLKQGIRENCDRSFRCIFQCFLTFHEHREDEGDIAMIDRNCDARDIDRFDQTDEVF